LKTKGGFAKDTATSIANASIGVARMFIPGHDEWLNTLLMKTTGTPWDGDVTNISSGQARKAMREHFVAQTPQGKAEIMKNIKNMVIDYPSVWSSYQVNDLIGTLFNDNVLFNGYTEDTLDQVLRNIGTIGNALYVGALAKSTLNIGKTVLRTGAIAALNTLDKKASQRLLGELINEVDQSKTLQQWGTKSVEVAQTQLPKPALGEAVNLPDGVAQAAEHVSLVRSEVAQISANMKRDLFTPGERLGAIEKIAAQIISTFGAKLRLGRSSIALTSDGSGVRFGSVLGSSDTAGFRDLEDARQLAKSLDESGTKATILEVDEHQNLRGVEQGDAILQDASSTRTGEFYVRFDQDYFFRPEDKLIFGSDPVVGPSWLGRTALWFTTPSSLFSPEVLSKVLRAQYGEQALTSSLNKMIAPVYKELSVGERRTVSALWEWGADFAKRENRLPTWSELRDAHPDITSKELTGWYRVKEFNNTLYHVNNDRLYREFAGRGYKTLYYGGARWHGKPLTREELGAHKTGDSYTVYSPALGEEITMSGREMTDFYENGMQVLELPIAVSAGESGNLSTLLLHVPNFTKLTALSRQPLKYIPGYVTRFYKDSIFIRRTKSGVVINGRGTEHATTVATAPDRRTAQEWVDKLNKQHGDDSVKFSISEDDPRITDRDRTARDLHQMQLEGRLFFDTRNAEPLASVLGGKAEVIDPINAMTRPVQMLSRQVATEDLVRTMKQQFFDQYASILGDYPETLSSSELTTHLHSMIKNNTGEVSRTASKANMLWDYVRVMEGSLYGGGVEFRRMAVRAADYLSEILPKGSRISKLASRAAEHFAPVENLKSLAFFDFLTSTPSRQILLQGSQHLFLQALDPLYAGRWQMDTLFLLSGARGHNLQLAGSLKDYKFLRTRNAKLMRMSPSEYDTVVTRFNQSGVAQAVNVHNFSSGILGGEMRTPMNAAERMGQGVANTLTVKPVRNVLNKVGFQAGETYNVAAAWLMALRRTMKERGYKNVSALGEKDWADVNARGGNFALAMNRANASKYQYGILSSVFQFLSFTHKTALTFMQSLPDWTQLGKLGNKSFTKHEARMVVAGQYLLFGATGFGLKKPAEEFLQYSGMDKYINTEVHDMLAGGFLDMVVDRALRWATDDPTIDLAVDKFLAPGANVYYVAQAFWDAATKKPVAEVLLGPSGRTLSRIVETASMAHQILNVNDPPLAPHDELTLLLEVAASGVATGYNNYVKARHAYRTGELLSQSGDPLSYNVNHTEAVALGLFGINSEGKSDTWALTMDWKQKQKELDATAVTFHTNVLKLAQLFADKNTYSKEYMVDRINQQRAMLRSLPPEEREYVLERVNDLEANRPPTEDSLATLIIKAIHQNIPVASDYLIYRIGRSNAISAEDKPILIEQIRKHEEALQKTSESMDAGLANEDKILRSKK
jgi:hypothetical protein